MLIGKINVELKDTLLEFIESYKNSCQDENIKVEEDFAELFKSWREQDSETFYNAIIFLLRHNEDSKLFTLKFIEKYDLLNVDELVEDLIINLGENYLFKLLILLLVHDDLIEDYNLIDKINRANLQLTLDQSDE